MTVSGAGRSRSGAWTRWKLSVRGVGLVTACAGLAGVAGCSPGSSAASAAVSCGTTRTGANVLVLIKVAKGNVDCAAALRAEQGYAAKIRAGQVQGNGGGAPVSVDGWTCESYPTPQVLRTGNASECHTANAEVVAVLALPASSVG